MIMKKSILEFLFTLFILTSLGMPASGSDSSPSCLEAVSMFLATPEKRTLIALSEAGEAECWSVIERSNSNLNQLMHLVEQGNDWSAQYLVEHLRALDGGNLEDSLIALGLFSDHHMERLLIFAKKGQLSKQELSDTLTMLPLSLSDNPAGQLDYLKARKNRVMRVTRKNLSEQKVQALSTIDNFESEIRSKNPQSIGNPQY
jgi:hypothetical protein